MQEWFATLLALILPAPERERCERQSPLDVPFWSLLLGVAELGSAFLYLVDDYLKTMSSIVARNADILGESIDTKDKALAYNWSGALNAVEWYLHPLVLFGFLVAITGGARMIAFVTTREAIGEPLVYVAVRLVQLLTRNKAQADLALSLGADRPDRFVEGAPGERFLLSARPRPDWQIGYSVDLEGEIFEVAGIELKVPQGERGKVYFYHLREQPPGKLIRRLVVYEPR